MTTNVRLSPFAFAFRRAGSITRDGIRNDATGVFGWFGTRQW